MRGLPEEFETSALIEYLAQSWGVNTEVVEYAALGGGSYHWVVVDRLGTQWFVTVDDLDRKPWLGDSQELVFDGLRCAFDTAIALRSAGLGFVVAPIATGSGESVRRVCPRYSVALFPFVDGSAGQFGKYEVAERAAVAGMLAQLHQAPAGTCAARRIDLDLPGRGSLEAALEALDETWLGGPFSEPARQVLGEHAADVAELLALADRLAAEVASRNTDWVVTHGEPHGANVMRIDEEYVLLDWDTVALAPPERDLWMLAGDVMGGGDSYTSATGYRLDPEAVSFFRLRWDLADLAAFTDVLRSPHRHTADTAWAYDGVKYCVAARARWASLLG